MYLAPMILAASHVVHAQSFVQAHPNGCDASCWRYRRRYLAEVPDAWAERVQAALPFLLAAAGGRGGAAFLLPALLAATDAPGAPAAAKAAQHAAWLAALRQPQVCMLHRF